MPKVKRRDENIPLVVMEAIGDHAGLTPNVDYALITEPARSNVADVHLQHAVEGFNDQLSDEVTAQLDAFFEPWNVQLKALILTSAGVKYVPAAGGGGPRIF